MNSYADQHHRKEQYLLGDWVYLKLQSYRKESLSHKLSFRHYEPCRITQKIGEVTCKLELREWESLAREEVIREDLEIMNLQFLEVDLGDREVLEGGGNDQDQDRYLKKCLQ